MAEIKTKPTGASVVEFIEQSTEGQKREDSLTILELMKAATGEEPVLWGASLIGFGNVTMKSAATGREVDWFRIGFSPRKANISLYIMKSRLIRDEAVMGKLGKYKIGAGCLYINKLADVDSTILQQLIETALKNDE